MSSHRYPERSDGFKPPPADYARDGRMYDDDPYADSDSGQSGRRVPHGPGRDQQQQQQQQRQQQRWQSRDGNPDEARNYSIRGRADSPPGRRQGGGGGGGGHAYRDRDRADYVSPSRRQRGSSSRDGEHGRHRYRSRSFSRERSPEYRGAPPSREVMLDGVPAELSEEDISYQLKTRYDVADLKDVRVIRDRDSGRPRGFAFVCFYRIDDAKNFVDSNYPTIELDSGRGDRESGRRSRVRVVFGRERDSWPKESEPDEEWTCASCSTLNFPSRKVCFRCRAPPPEDDTYARAEMQQQEFLESGDSDAAMQGPPSHFLLIRGLDLNMSEEIFAKGVSKLLKPGSTGQAANQPSKKAKVVSTTGDANLGAREGSIKRVFLVRNRSTDDSSRYGFAEFSNPDEASAAITRFESYDRFTISSKPVTVSFIHTGVFVPVFDPQNHDPKFSFSPLANPSLRLQYWNQHLYVSELAVNTTTDDSKSVAGAETSAADAAAIAAAKEGIVATTEEAIAKAKKRKAESKEKEASKTKKATPSHLQFWSNRHAELHGIKEKSTDADGGGGESKSEGEHEKLTHDSRDLRPDDSRARSYADPVKMCCYLCSRQFKSTVELNKHERLSGLHRTNLQDGNLRSKAVAKLEKAGISAASSSSQDASEYRDRARERRQAFGPGKKILLPLKKQNPDHAANTTAAANSTTPEKEEAAPPVKSKGAALLGKMGWTTGEGLGARGEGSTTAIETNVYASGVGLGADGGKLGDAAEEAARNSRGDYKEFLQVTKDKARSRYENM